MKQFGPLSSLANSRAGLLVAAWLYSYAMHFAHVTYLTPEWEYYGFTYRAPSAWEVFSMAVLVGTVAATLPLILTRASSIILLLLFLMVYVPAVVLSLSLDAGGDVDRIKRYGPSLAMLALAFAIACFVTRKRRSPSISTDRVPDKRFCRYFVLAWAASCATLLINYSSIMTFSFAIEEIYDQRSTGTATGIWMGYLQTYFGSVLSPALIALGLATSRTRLVLAGLFGCFIMYMIAAQRIVLLMPFVIIPLFFLLKSRVLILRASVFLTGLMTLVVFASTALYVESAAASFLSMLLVFRTLALPGLFFTQYFDLFSTEGYTWWSHVRGINLLVPIPAAFANDPYWPALGYIVGDRVYNNAENNSNASLFAGDGIAAAGAFGVLVIGVVFAMWLRLLDRSTRGWDRTFVMLVAFPLGLTLANVQFFTTMLSFGGLAWILIFYFYKPRADLTRGHMGTTPYPAR